ncbi:6-phosphogluconate phosphatase [Pseudovibrio axinellae]|uniref:6-phosphogluconate phosphatase n=1 Tax=Pseudovibrio axinellae TaxID=989403 RepID=A0A165YEU4_9HYPH|nr:HAD family hydrolase [Pseudovibrio axinellae]KZL18781.1 6-phosphogluconate phosphatase [Pseudovibrio axinellae]SEP93024.1 haloacid dehalogenase superfamily, subfamily IA, variant 3 with third motif having DD or ED/haloacid dehalogenase superfamily, subfamily IA, variant 1 with third motif having Dx(3-4)D or Dx(3-4)E [Pseudovibrio axinellae]
MNYDLLIWDCDGCLIDSEWIGCQVEAEGFTKAGYPITTEQMIARFCGVSSQEVFGQIKAEIGKDIRFHDALINQEQALQAAFEQHLQPIAGIHDALHELDTKFPEMRMCIASGSSMERLEYTLKLTDLHDRFENRYYSAETVAKGKPAPDVFLKAAEQMNVDPQKCLVIEDSHLGLQAARAAGMDALGFTGATHGGQGLHQRLQQQKPLAIFESMTQLPSVLADLSK